MAKTIRFGVEEEFFLTDLDTGSVMRYRTSFYSAKFRSSL